MQPTPEPAPAPAPTPPTAVGDGLVEFLRADRQRAAYILLGLGAVLLALCGWAAYKAYKAPAATEEKKKEDRPAIEEEEAKPKAPNRNEYFIAALLAGLGCAAIVGAGGWLLVSQAPPDEARQRTDVRTAVLIAGGSLGAVLILAGGVYFYLWSSALSDWLDGGQTKQAKFVLLPLLAVAFGGALMFLAVQPARADERNNRLLRQLIYGTNLGLSVLLLAVVLIIVNLVVSPKLPNKLDTTETRFYTLAPGTVEFLQKLPEPVTAYTVLVERRGIPVDDIQRLLRSVQEASGGKFVYKPISPSDKEYLELRDKYPLLDANETGILLTVGEDRKRNSLIRDDEFTQTEPVNQRDPHAPPPARAFVGESRLLKELLFLAEGDKKAVVYFTQSAGELDIGGPTPGEEVGERPTARVLKEYLTQNYLDVRPLKFEGTAPRVPDDAAVVIVAQPRVPLAPAHVDALRRYMTEPRAGKKGKLIVLAGAEFEKEDLLPTGLEAMLLEFNVVLDNRYLMCDRAGRMDEFTTLALFTEDSRRARNPVAISLGSKTVVAGRFWRRVMPNPQGGPAYNAVPLLVTMAGRRSWVESRLPRQQGEVAKIVSEVITNNEVAKAKQRSDGSRIVGVAVSENEVKPEGTRELGRIVVIGNGATLGDTIRNGEAFDIVSASIDWLRDRPPLNIQVQEKKYKEFLMPGTANETRGLWLPLLLAVLIVTGLGASVWVIRRRSA